MLVVDDEIRAAIGIVMVASEQAHRVSMKTPSEILDDDRVDLKAFDRIVVDVWDAEADQTSTATDVMTGIDVLRRVHRESPQTVTIAVIPALSNPLLVKRVIDARPHAVVEEVSLNSVTAIRHITGTCGRDCTIHQLDPVSDDLLRVNGFAGKSPNDVVDAYRSYETLYGKVKPGVTKASLGRRQATNLRDDLISAGIVGIDHDRPRWREVVRYLHRILGR